MSLPAALQSQLDDLALYPDRSDRIQALIEIGSGFVNPTVEAFPRLPENRVPGCESEVFVAVQNGKFVFAVDNPQGISAMAMAQILAEGLIGATPKEISVIPEEIVFDIFGRELSMGKSLGLTGMVKMVKALAAREL